MFLSLTKWLFFVTSNYICSGQCSYRRWKELYRVTAALLFSILSISQHCVKSFRPIHTASSSANRKQCCGDSTRKTTTPSKIVISDLLLKGRFWRADSWSLSSRQVFKQSTSILIYCCRNFRLLRLLLTLCSLSTFITIFSVLSNLFNFKRADWQLFKLLFEILFVS